MAGRAVAWAAAAPRRKTMLGTRTGAWNRKGTELSTWAQAVRSSNRSESEGKGQSGWTAMVATHQRQPRQPRILRRAASSTRQQQPLA